MARDGAQTEILRVAIASELNIPTTELTAKSYPAAGGVTHTEEIFDGGTHAAQATPAQLIDPNLELTVFDLPDGASSTPSQHLKPHSRRPCKEWCRSVASTRNAGFRRA
jgi:hypothetical protein